MVNFSWKIIFLCILMVGFVGCSNNGEAEQDEAYEPAGYVENDPPENGEVEPTAAACPNCAAPAVQQSPAPDPEPSPWADAAEMVATMRVGWNLGNTLDAHPHGNTARFADTVEQHETYWGNPFTTRENIETIRDAGFDVLRVPVTWYARLVDGCENYSIREDWMERVITVVNYGLDAGMFVIVNVHHDERLFGLFDGDMDDSIVAVTRLWEQIGYTFRDYSHMLIFEGLNEPRTVGSAAEWNGGTAEERANVNLLNQVFVDTVRLQGGNNSNRMLMVPTYAAAVLNQTINEFVLPNDPANDENKLIVSLHMYAPYQFALTLGSQMRLDWSPDVHADTNPITWGLDLAYNTFVRNGIPVIMGEMGALNRDNLEARVAWTYFYVTEATRRGILCIWWDNGRFGTSLRPADGDHFAILNRWNNTFPFPEIIDALMEATS
jgi:endoglucanase